MRSTAALLALPLLLSSSIFACSKSDTESPYDNGEKLAPSAAVLPLDSGAVPSASASAAAAPSASTPVVANAPGSADCGSRDNPCPLQKWMKEHTQPDLSAGDMSALAADLEKIATFAPPGFGKWVSISKDGAAAARAANTDAAKAACRGCHTEYKSKYKTEMRPRALP